MNISEQILLNKAPQISSSDGEMTVDGILQTLDKPDATLDSAWAVEAEERMSAFKAGMLEAVDSDAVFEALGKRV
jgi:Putative addiction module component